MCAVSRFCRHCPCFRSWRKKKSPARRQQKAKFVGTLSLHQQECFRLSPAAQSSFGSSAKLGWSGFTTHTRFLQAGMGDPIQSIRHASLVVAEGDPAPAKPPAKPKGVGQGSAAPTPPPPPVVKDRMERDKGEIEIKEANKKRPLYESL